MRQGTILEAAELEKQAMEKGRVRYEERRITTQQLTTFNVHHRILTEALTNVAKELSDTIEEQRQTTGRRYAWFEQLDGLDCDLLAYIGLSTCMDGVGKISTRTTVMNVIGRRIQMERLHHHLQENDKGLLKRIERKIKTDQISPSRRQKTARLIAKKAGVTVDDWPPSFLVQVAAPVYNAVMKASGVFEEYGVRELVNGRHNTRKLIDFTGEASDAIANMEMSESCMEPMFQPTLVPPRDWVALDTGCYMDEALSTLVPLIKDAKPWQRRQVEKDLASGKRIDYIDAVNAIQRVPYAINQYVLEAVKWAYESGASFGKFPVKDHLELPDRLPDDAPGGEVARRNKRVRKILTKNREIDGNKAIMRQTLETANWIDDKVFYLPHNYDFRGRLYPVCNFSHHSDDYRKALLNLANAKPMTDDGLLYLAIHVAKCGDFNRISKGTIDEMLNWCVENEDMIFRVGRDYKESFEVWSQADKPFQFLAACEAYYRTSTEPGYECGLPIGLDGSNSGIQHYSAAALSKADGKLVNLVPMDKPQDIYQAVSDKTTEILKGMTDEPLARAWLDFGVDRKLVKRNTMTFPYSSSTFGFANQIMSDTLKPYNDAVFQGKVDRNPLEVDGDYGSRAANLLAKVNFDSIRATVTGADACMRFIKGVASLCSAEGKAMLFRTPDGFPVAHTYGEWDTKKVRIFLFDREMRVLERKQLTVRQTKKIKLNKTKMRNAAAPNVIHAMDANHLRAVILGCLMSNPQIKSLSLIHDSFGAVPSDLPALFHIVRSTFVEQYEDYNLFESLRTQVGWYLDNKKALAKLEAPERGDLDLQQVVNSDYCFL